MQTAAAPRIDIPALGFFLCCVAAAGMIGWICVNVNQERACALQESPAVDFCAPRIAGNAGDAELLRTRIARDPGDADAYIALALADRSPARVQLVDTAARLAPREPNLLLERAGAALDRRDWGGAIPPLMELADGRDVPLAAKSLAWLVANGQGALLEPYLVPGSHWLERVLMQMRASGSAFSGALPLVIRALQLGVIDGETVRGYVRDLKAAGAWADAYGLWLSLHGKSLPVLFNGSFDHTFEVDGFDWEVPLAGPARRAGAIVERRRAEGRGGVLDLQFTGRTVALPIVRQYLFLGPGRYRMHGDYFARQFRMEDGLVWVMRCTSGTAGRSGPIADTGGLWRSFDFDVSVPANCGLVTSLQLEAANPADAALGARGRVSFDAFTLERIGS